MNRRDDPFQIPVLMRATIALGCCVALGCVAQFPSGGSESRESSPTSGGYLNQAIDVAYVGKESCRLCHFGKASTFDNVGMGRSFYPLTPDRVVEDFSDRNLFVDTPTGLHYRMTERDGRYYQRQFLLDEDGGETAVSEYELSWIVGSNNHGRAYVVEREGKLFQAPVCWNPSTERWIFCPGFEHKNDHYSRELSYTCVFCHNGRMELEPGERNLYTAAPPHGIGCERCHGPGQLHVERWMRGDRIPAGSPDPTIVNPRALPLTERLHVCVQCHLGDTNATERVRRFDRPLSSWRPGQPITDVLVPFRYVEQTPQEYGLVSQADRMLLSRCYTESGGKMECLTCHNPHVSTYRTENPAEFYRARCLTCHELDACSAPSAEREATESPDDCVSCHMLVAEPVDRRYTLFTDHWIRRRIDEPQRRRENFDLEPVFADAFAALTEGEQAYYRGRANYLRAIESAPYVSRQLWPRAERSFREAIAAGLDIPDVWFFLGKTQIYLGRIDLAVEPLQQAVQRDPGHHDAAFALGQTFTGLGRFEQARAVFAEMLRRDADDPMALAEYGRTLWTLGRPEEALTAYDQAIELEPWRPTLHLNRGMTLASVGRLEEAAEAAREAVRRDPDGLKVWEFYANVMRAAGKPEEEARALRYLESRRRSASASP